MTFRIIISAIICLFMTASMLSQDCLDYPEIGGLECGACVPEGWEAFSGTTPDIVPTDGSYPFGGCNLNDISGDSPGGGNVILLAGAPPAYQEGITTTVSGLDPSFEYGFGFYWEQITADGCGDWASGNLIVEVDGETYTYDDAESWEFIEFCFFPSGESIDITFMIEVGIEQTILLVDSPDCADVTACCLLQVEADETYTICPGEEQLFFAEYFDANGGVDIEWTSDPDEGVDFLDDPNSITPKFLMPIVYDFEGEEYIFTLTVEDDDCERMKELILIVEPNIIPEFDIYLCELDEDPEFPATSLDGFTGVWDGDFDLQHLGGTTQEFTFTLDPDQNNCLESWEYSIPIEAEIELNFIYQSVFCALDDTRYTLPVESDENIPGEWDIEKFNPYELGPGTYLFTFYVEEYFCAKPYEFLITVEPTNELTFDIPSSFCQENDTIFLPPISNEGIEGSWSESIIDLNQQVTDHDLYFQLDNPLFGCYDDYQFAYSVTNGISSTFNIEDTICRSADIIVFDSSSIEGYLGFWQPLSVLPDTISNNPFILHWTPLPDQASCLNDTMIEITILEDVEPVFNLPVSLCINSGIYILPDTSNNNIPGSWNIPVVDTEINSPDNLSLIFTPEANYCSDIFITQLEITGDLIPEFSIENILCSNQAPFDLPLVSDNGISGQWDIPTIDPSTILDSMMVEFIPDGNANDCVTSAIMTFYVNSLIDPTFFLPASFCTKFGNYPFSTTSVNGISGQWSTPEFDPDDFIGTIFTNVFTPDDLSCFNSISIDIPVIHFEEITFNTVDPSSCTVANGTIIIEDNAGQFEYSIDNGLTWQSEASFEMIPAGPYTIMVRSLIDPYCMMQYQLQLSDPSAPVIDQLVATPISNCESANGTIRCDAQGQNLEYSIDNGMTWLSSNLFTDLSDGLYTVMVRSADSPDCISEDIINISPVTTVNLIDVLINDVSDCDIFDGGIEISVVGNNLQYSIDGGLSWQDDPVFTNLVSGMYHIIVEDNLLINCLDDTLVNISGPMEVNLLDLVASHPEDCEEVNGSIEFIATGNEPEYSIDGGLNWSDNPLFLNLAPGNYHCIVRESNAVSCSSEMNIILEWPPTPQLIDLLITDPSDCISEDGSIQVQSDLLDVEFSIDGGISWQPSNNFDMLAEGTYLLEIRNATSPNCKSTYPFELKQPVCPCNALDITFQVRPVNCTDVNSGAIEITDIQGYVYDNEYDIVWQDGSSESAINNLTTDWYVVQIFYDKNCTWTDSVFVDAIDPLSFGLLSFDADCRDLGSIQVVDLEGGSGEFSYSLDGTSFQSEGVFFNLSAQDYQVYIEDILGCRGNGYTSIDANLELELELPQIEPISPGMQVTLNPLINVTSIDSFYWSPSASILNPGELIAQVAPLESTEYSLEIFFGRCSELRTVFIEVIDQRNIYLGDIFTPNGDGNNDVFFIQSAPDLNLQIHEFLIYDRWGNLVYQNFGPDPNNTKDGWDGSLNGEYLIPGVYLYLINYELNEASFIKSGPVTLVR